MHKVLIGLPLGVSVMKLVLVSKSKFFWVFRLNLFVCQGFTFTLREGRGGGRERGEREREREREKHDYHVTSVLVKY